MRKYLVIALAAVMLLVTGCGANEPVKLERGSIEGSVYTNKSADVTFTLPDGWSFSEQEVLDSLMSQTGKTAGEDAAANIESTTVYDCMAVSQDASCAIAFFYEDVGLSNNPDISEKEYADALKNSLLSSDSMDGITYDIGEFSDITVGGNSYYGGTVRADFGDAAIEQRYLTRKIGDYMFSIYIMTIPGVSVSSDEILAAIS